MDNKTEQWFGATVSSSGREEGPIVVSSCNLKCRGVLTSLTEYRSALWTCSTALQEKRYVRICRWWPCFFTTERTFDIQETYGTTSTVNVHKRSFFPRDVMLKVQIICSGSRRLGAETYTFWVFAELPSVRPYHLNPAFHLTISELL